MLLDTRPLCIEYVLDWLLWLMPYYFCDIRILIVRILHQRTIRTDYHFLFLRNSADVCKFIGNISTVAEMKWNCLFHYAVQYFCCWLAPSLIYLYHYYMNIENKRAYKVTKSIFVNAFHLTVPKINAFLRSFTATNGTSVTVPFVTKCCWWKDFRTCLDVRVRSFGG